AARPLRLNAVPAPEKRLTEQSLRLEVPLIGGEKQPPDRLAAVLVDARTFEMHPRQMILGVGIAKCGCRKLEHLEGASRIGMQLAVGYPVQIISPKRDKSARNDREVTPVRVVLVITRGNLGKIIISLE